MFKNKLTILYIEDDPFVQEATSMLLQECCQTLYVANDGEEGYEKYLQYQPDLIITDLNMPKVSGLEFIKKVREHNLNVSIIITSAYSEKEKLFSAIKLGVSDYLTKPFSFDTLKQSIDKSLKKLQTVNLKMYDTLLESVALLDKKFAFHYVNKAFLEMFHFSKFEQIQSVEVQKIFTNHLFFEMIEQLEDEVVVKNIYCTKANKTHLLVKVKMKKVFFEAQEMILISMVDVSEIAQEAAKDALTGLDTKYTLKEEFQNLLHHSSKHSCGAIFIDIDNFKLINDNVGHQFGDRVIQKLAEILKNETRKNDLVFRWGGDEFLIFTFGTTLEETTKIAENLRQKINALEFEEYSDFTCSFGVDIVHENDSLEDVIDRIDNALLSAKEYSKNCVVVYG